MPTPEAGRWFGLAALVVVLDQLSKAWVLAALHQGDVVYVAPFFNWVLTYNPGAAFSLLANAPGWQRWFFSGLAFAISAWIAVMLYRHPQQRLQSAALALVMGGALGNVVDRIRFGAVVDFVQWHAAGYYWPAFNVADSAISLGAALLVWEQLFAAKGPSDTTTSNS